MGFIVAVIIIVFIFLFGLLLISFLFGLPNKKRGDSVDNICSKGAQNIGYIIGTIVGTIERVLDNTIGKFFKSISNNKYVKKELKELKDTLIAFLVVAGLVIIYIIWAIVNGVEPFN